MQRFSLILSCLLLFVLTHSAVAQSGRGRPVTPSRETTPQPTPAPVLVPEATSIVKREQAGNLSRFVLKNGITVLIHERHAYPTAAVVAYFKIPETEATTSAAALLPKMMMRGTPFRSGEQLINEARAIGCLMNAEAHSGNLIFSFVTPPDKLKDALAIQADVIQHPAFADDEIKRQTAALPTLQFANTLGNAPKSSDALFQLDSDYLLERDDAAGYSLSRLLNMAMGKASATTASAITREQLVQFYQANLRPENLVFTVVGDITPFNALVEIQRLYGGFNQNPASPENPTPAGNKPENPPARPQPNAARSNKTAANTAQKTGAQTIPAKPAPTTTVTTTAEATKTEVPKTEAPKPEKAELHYTNERGDLTQSVISVGFRLPNLDAKEQATLTVLATLLADGRGSRLSRSLFIGQGVLSRAEANVLNFADKGLLAVQMWLDPAMIDRAEAAFFREVNRLRREIPTEAEVTRARMLAENQFVALNRDDLQRALWLAASYDAQQPLRQLNEARQRLQEVKGEEIQRAAAKDQMLANTSVHEYEPLTAAPRTFDATQFATTVANWAAGFNDAIDAKQVRAAEESFALLQSQAAMKSEQELSNLESIEPLPVKNFSTLNGPQAFVREDRSQPFVTIAILFPGGRILEEEANQGITELMLRAMLYGTAKRPQAIEELEQLGATVEVVNKADFYGLMVNTLSRNANQALRIARELVEEAAFRDEDIVKARNEQISLIRSHRDGRFSRADELLMQGLFGNHPYAFPAHGLEATLAKLNGEAVKDWYAHTIKHFLPLLVVVGDTDGSALISGEVANNFRRKDPETTMRARVPQAIKPAEKVEPRKMAVTAIDVGFAGAKSNTDDGSALDILEAAMNGNSGRLMVELGGKQNLVSEAFLNHQGMLLMGVIGAYLLTTAENEQRAATALGAELDRLTKTGLSSDELKNAKALALTTSLLHWRASENRALAYAHAVFFQKEAADVDTTNERLAKVTGDEIKRAAAVYFKSSSAAVGIVRGTATQK
jgi:zinc protease